MMNQVAISCHNPNNHNSLSSAIRSISFWKNQLLACFFAFVLLPLGFADEPRNDAMWTPPVHRTGKIMPYEQETDEHWMDDRVRRMDSGPFLTSSVTAPDGKMIPKAIAIRLDNTVQRVSER